MAIFSRQVYETLLYSLKDQNTRILTSTIRLYSTSATTGSVKGSIHFDNDIELRVYELVDLSDGEIFSYSYEIFQGGIKIRWYDPQPHPEDESLSNTFPHHFHKGPDIKHHRIPAKGVTFQAPNLPTLIQDCLSLD